MSSSISLTSTYSESVAVLTTSAISTNTATLTTGAVPTATITANTTSPLADTNVDGTILVIARDAASAAVAVKGLNGYGIPYQTLLVPTTGATLPALNSSSGGNFGGIIIASAVSYDVGGLIGFTSALTADQWNQLYAYQLAYHVRMVQYDVWPDATMGVTGLGGCCATGQEQLVSFSNTTAFPQAGLKSGAGVTTQGLYHYPASIVDHSTTWEIAQFASNANFSSVTTAAVINNFNGREQMVFFLPFSQDWSPTSNYIQHAYITWMTRGLYAGYRRAFLNTQIDDMMLETDIYFPNSSQPYRVTPADMTEHANWVNTINQKLNAGSNYHPEIGHNGNGAVIEGMSAVDGEAVCSPGAIDYENCHCDTELEFQKPLGGGISVWPQGLTTYNYTMACNNLDDLQKWFAVTSNRDQFYHLSHTFTHLELNNATYDDALKEIQFNQAWLSQVGLTGGTFSPNALIPPAITGIHNGDVIRAWKTAGLTNCVGDNTRVPLRNADNDMWPYITTAANNGNDGFTVVPRWATRIYYNCDTGDCTTKEWIATSAGSGTFSDLLAVEKADTSRHLFGLFHDPYMFHQANLRYEGVGTTTINGVAAQISIFQAWVETMVQEFVRLVDWPLISERQTDFAQGFLDRMARDQCGYKLGYTISDSRITAVTVTSTGNTCGVPIPVTFPGPVTDVQGFRTEQVGNDPLTVWARLGGSPVSFTLSTPMAV